MNEEKKEILYYRSGKDTSILHAVQEPFRINKDYTSLWLYPTSYDNKNQKMRSYQDYLSETETP